MTYYVKFNIKSRSFLEGFLKLTTQKQRDESSLFKSVNTKRQRIGNEILINDERPPRKKTELESGFNRYLVSTFPRWSWTVCWCFVCVLMIKPQIVQWWYEMPSLAMLIRSYRRKNSLHMISPTSFFRNHLVAAQQRRVSARFVVWSWALTGRWHF